MKKIGLLSFVLIVALAIALAAQAPPAGGQGGQVDAAGGGAGAPGGGAQAAVADAVDGWRRTWSSSTRGAGSIADFRGHSCSSNQQTGCRGIDEDAGNGRALPGRRRSCNTGTVWVMRLTTGTPAKVFTI